MGVQWEDKTYQLFTGKICCEDYSPASGEAEGSILIFCSNLVRQPPSLGLGKQTEEAELSAFRNLREKPTIQKQRFLRIEHYPVSATGFGHLESDWRNWDLLLLVEQGPPR